MGRSHITRRCDLLEVRVAEMGYPYVSPTPFLYYTFFHRFTLTTPRCEASVWPTIQYLLSGPQFISQETEVSIYIYFTTFYSIIPSRLASAYIKT